MKTYKINTNRIEFRDLFISTIEFAKKSFKAINNLFTNTKLVIVESQAYHWLDYRNYQRLARTLHATGLLVMAGLILFSAISPLVDIYVTHKYYTLNSNSSKLVGNVSDTLAKQITYDSTKNAYVFNAAGMTPTTQTVGPDKVPLSLLQAKVSGNKSAKTLYSVIMPADPKQGISYYDSNTGLSFQLVPDFTQMSGEQVSNHVVYPINKDMQMVYSVRNNGLKEDIVLKQFTTDSFTYSYSLKLPGTLEARMLADGSGDLGIYSADPALFTHSTFGADYDPAKIESAQLHAKKDHLVFAIPAPVIKQTGNSGQGAASANFVLSNNGNTLTVRADNLRGLHYPITVDPTVVLTSTSDFGIGNNEDNNISYPANQINRGSLTGGSISGGWTATTALTTALWGATSIAYNGYIYEIGGFNGSVAITNVNYAPINSNGTIGAWAATTALPVATYYATSVTYNGYVYEIGGVGTAAAVYYAPINANGTIGSWTATTALPSATQEAASVVYNGYLYEIGGYTTTYVTTVTYAPINANGTIGSWTTTTALPVATSDHTSVAYNGYLYAIGGINASSAQVATVYYAPINANGTVGTWNTTTVLPVVTSNHTSVVYSGYLYVIGGSSAGAINTVDYAQINANGTLSAWTATSSLPAATIHATSVVYNGYLYMTGGGTTTATTTVDYAKIDPAGVTTAYTGTTALPAATYQATSVAYNGYVYEIGGYAGGPVTTVEYAAINTNGTIGAWTATTALPAVTMNATSVVYNGYLYEIGGWSGSATIANVYYAPINANGTIGAWTATTALPNPTYAATSVVYNGYVYEIGGAYSPSAPVVNVYYAPINANGTIGAWTATTAMPTVNYFATSVVYNGYVYEIGGSAPSYVSTVYYAPINANGTIGSWTATTSLPAVTDNATSVVYNGYLYEIGGGNGTLLYSTVYYAVINSNGTIGAWTATTSIPTGTWVATSVVYNGYIYEIGGSTGTATANTYYALINNGGPGTVGAWTATTVLPAATRDSTAIAYNGYLYEIGGWNGSNLTTVEYAVLNSNGTIGSWTATTSLPVATANATSVAYNGYLYEIGGTTTITYDTPVYYAPINTNGTIGSWSATTSLPTGTNAATSVAYNGYIYEIGGNTGSPTTTVEFALINANGTIGAWTATTVLPTATYGATSVVYNGYLYEIGGNTGSATATVEYALINANGTIGTWAATTSLRLATYYSASVAYNGYLYEIGGNTAGGTIANVEYAPIIANGSIGAWTAATALPVATRAPSVVYNGYIYLIGGFTGGNVTTVDYAPLNVMPRVGHYSQMFNFGSAGITPFSITYNGSLPNANGLSSIQYKTAGSNAVLGASQYSTALNGTSTNCNTVGTVQYVSVFITLDDSGSATFPDVNTTPANVTDFTVTYNTYHPSPNLRLRGGKFFSSNVQQPLDTCSFVPVPNSPAIGTATDNGSGRTYNNGSAVVSFTPSPTGYAATSYTVTASSGGYSTTGVSSPLTVTGLQSGVSYTFTVTAKNAIGSSNPSLASNSITATTLPQAPTIGTATDTGSGRAYNNGLATISFTAGGTGGLSTTYVATASAGGYTGSGSSPISVAGLQSGASYSFTITATNANGSVTSASSNTITATTIPQAPTIGTATVTGNHTASVSYTANGTGGLSNTYSITSSPVAGSGSGASPIAVSGLAIATSYSFTVTAANSNGSATSAGSNTITTTGSIVSGGTLTSDSTYYYRTFTASGTLGVSGSSLTSTVLAVGGGGAGGGYYGGGGGAGGVSSASVSLSGSVAVTVGGGGASMACCSVATGNSGNPSSISTVTGVGGGGGGGQGQNGASGGSGGGASGSANTSGGSGSQGNHGGAAFASWSYTGGGGGAGAAGTDATSTGSGSGGAGTSAYSSWAPIIALTGGAIAGGGGGGGVTTGSPGSGGGGPANGGSGSANTGGGGGGSNGVSVSGAGGSGIVIVRYLKTATD